MYSGWRFVSFGCSMQQHGLMISSFRLATGWRSYTAIGKGNGASGLMINGASVLHGATATLMTSK